MMKRAVSRPEVVGIAAALVDPVADLRAVRVAVPVERLEVPDHPVPGLVAEPPGDLDLARRLLLALLRDGRGHAGERRDLRIEVDEDVRETLLLVLLVDHLLAVLAQE